MRARRHVGNVGAAAGDGRQRRLHGRLVNVMPEGPKVHLVCAILSDEEVRINGIVCLAAVGADANATVVCPGPDLHVIGRGKSNDTVLGAEGRHSIVEVVEAIHI